MPKQPKAGGRLRNPSPERDAPADTSRRDHHHGMCIGYLNSHLESFREFLTEPQYKGTRIHKDDARQMKHLLLEFEVEMLELFKGMRVQQHGVRDKAVDDRTRTKPSNVVSFVSHRTHNQEQANVQ